MSHLFRLFVSSTFSDFVAEREALQRRVFPAIDAVCRAYGARFQAVDLRWGVSEDAGRDRQTLEICLGEIARCQRTTPRPNFLALIGDRYGWRPLPRLIDADEFDAIVAATQDPADRARLLDWYTRDTNAVPAARVLSPLTNKSAARWPKTEQKIAATLRRGISSLRRRGKPRRRYFASATEHELDTGVLEPKGAAAHVLCVRRVVDGLPDDSEAYRDRSGNPRLDSEATALRAKMEKRLRAALGPRFVELTTRWNGSAPADTHIGDLPRDAETRMSLLDDLTQPSTLCAAVWKGLVPIILERCRAAAEEDELQREITVHDDFARARIRVFVGREQVLERIREYADSTDPHPVVLVGEAGSGKSSVMARALVDLRARRPAGTVIGRFVGTTAASTSGTILLSGLCRQLARLGGQAEPDLKAATYDELARLLSQQLTEWPAQKPLALVLDALDQLAAGDRARNLAWLPHRIPPHVRVIASVTPGELSRLLDQKLGEECFIRLDVLSAADGTALLLKWLAGANRSVAGEQRDLVRRAAARSGLPLYLRLIFEEVRRWRSYDGLPHGADGRRGLPDDVAGALDDLCWRLSAKANHGAVLVARALGYLAASRHGLTDDEMVDVLSRDGEVLADFRRRSPKSPAIKRLPDVIWARLFFDLEAYLAERNVDDTSTLSFFHRSIGELLAQRFLDGGDGISRHRALAAYFDDQPLEVATGGAHGWNRRKLSELPFQLAASQHWTELTARLTSFEFLSAKTTAQGPNAMIEDLDRAIAAADHIGGDATADLTLLRATLRLSAHILARDPAQLRTQLHARIPRPTSSRIQSLLDQAERAPGPWLKPLTPDFWHAGGPVISTIVAHNAAVNGIAITPDGRTGISVSSDGTLKVWDLVAERERFVLSVGTTEWLSVGLTRDGATAIAGGNEGTIAVWDVASGRLVRQWKGERGWRALVVSEDNGWVSTGSEDRELVIWDLEGGPIIKRVPLGDSAASNMALSADGRTLLCGGGYDSVSVLRLPAAEVSRELSHGYDRWVSSVALTHDGRTALSGDFEGNVHVWDVETGRRRARLGGFRHDEQITAVAVTPDGHHALAASRRGQLNIYDLTTAADGPDLSPIAHFGTGAHRITHVALAPDGARAISAAEDATLRVWNLSARDGTGLRVDPAPFADDDGEYDDEGRILRVGGGSTASALLGPPETRTPFTIRLAGFQGPLVEAPAHAPGRTITERAPRDKEDDRRVRQKVAAVDFQQPIWLDQDRLESAAVSRDGRMLACFGLDATLAVWDLSGPRKTSSLQAETLSDDDSFVAKSPLVTCGGRRVAALLNDGLYLFNVDAREPRQRLVSREIGTFMLTPDDACVAAFCRDGWLRFWDVADGSEVVREGVPTGSFTAFVGRFACWLAPDGSLARFDLLRRERLRTLNDFGRGVEMSPDGNFAVTSRESGGLVIWHLSAEAIVGSLPEAEVRNCAIVLTSTGGLLVTGGSSLTLWDVASARRLAAVTGDGPLVAGEFDQEGTVLTAHLHAGGEHRFRVEGWAELLHGRRLESETAREEGAAVEGTHDSR